MSNSFASIKHLNLSISIKMSNWLRESYTTKFDFMSYAFAKLVAVWL